MKVIVGLGNPGPKYRGTRHNVGYDVLDYLAKGPGASSFRSRFQGQLAELNEDGLQILLLKPETFMNLSGRSVRELADFYKVSLDDLLIVSDDINLPLGKLRMRARGSHGGHNGLRNIQEQLGTMDYPRLRIGVDAPGLKYDDAAIDHVLGRFRPGERSTIDDAISKAALAALYWAKDGIAVAMSQTNGPEDAEKPKKKKPKDGEKDGSEKKPKANEAPP
jgi:peptidyl-tRNA hydrolase, PTH1 family